VTHLICDEADSLFDRSFKPSTTEILDRATPSLKKLILCSATIPKYLDKYLADKFPDMNRLVTPNLHAIPRRVQLGVVDVNKDPYHGNKMLACADTIWQIGRSAGEYDPAEGKEAVPTKRILVFVNERDDTDEVAQYLVKKGIDALAFHRDTAIHPLLSNRLAMSRRNLNSRVHARWRIRRSLSPRIWVLGVLIPCL
jgi:ATP-dependent RNA helicase MRH4